MWRNPRQVLERAMSTYEVRYRLHTVVALAELLECVENGTAHASADGYRLLVQRLQVGLSQDFPADVLLSLLDEYPAASQVFENMHYEHNGLSRSPLDRSVSSELMARQILTWLSRGA
jgi:hypothetical protein